MINCDRDDGLYSLGSKEKKLKIMERTDGLRENGGVRKGLGNLNKLMDSCNVNTGFILKT